MIKRSYFVRRALENAHRDVGYAFCKALGVLHLIGVPNGYLIYEEQHTEGLIECFANSSSPMDRVVL